MHSHHYHRGDQVVYRCRKMGTHPPPHARDIRPEVRGEVYHYCVFKYWVVNDVLEDGRLVVRTRRGKTRVLDPNDRGLRPAHWWEMILYASRFPQLGLRPAEILPKIRPQG